MIIRIVLSVPEHVRFLFEARGRYDPRMLPRAERDAGQGDQQMTGNRRPLSCGDQRQHRSQPRWTAESDRNRSRTDVRFQDRADAAEAVQVRTRTLVVNATGLLGPADPTAEQQAAPRQRASPLSTSACPRPRERGPCESGPDP